MLKHRGYTGRVEFDDQAKIFHGEVIDLNDVITFQGTSPDEIIGAFQDSIDDYIAFCNERGEKPDRPFSGKLVLRLPHELHRQVYVRAHEAGMSLNKWITSRLEQSV